MLEFLGNSEVADLGLEVGIEEDILGLEISVENPFGVELMKSHAYLNQQFPDSPLRQTLFVHFMALNQLREISFPAVFHHYVEMLPFLES